MIEEDKVMLVRKRAELVESLGTQLSVEGRTRVQGELALVNAKIKALNTTEAARLKAAADRRKRAGLAEAQANTLRGAAHTRSRINGAASRDAAPEDDNLEQTIDGWIDALLLRHDVDFTRSREGKLALDAPLKWGAVIGGLIDGIYAAGRRQELPELPNEAAKAPKGAKPKRR